MKNLIVTVLVFIQFYSFAQTTDENWRVLPVRSQIEYQQGSFGGAGEQHPHSFARCYQHPEYIYLSQDVAGTWRSIDNGDTWEKNWDIGLFLPYGQSIEVDPVNPDIVLVILDDSYNYRATQYQGVYRSENGGKNWKLVLQTPTAINRIYRHNLEFDRTKMNGNEPVKTWYAAMVNNGLFRSDDGGKTWSSKPVSSLQGHDKLYQVRTHPTDSQKVYVASSLGLFLSTKRGEELARVEALPVDVSSIDINPNNPDSIFATVPGNGLYLSKDGGTTFSSIRSHSAVRLHMNPGFPEEIYLVGNSKNSVVSHNGGATWSALPVVTTFPGLGRETGWRRWIDGNLSGIVPNPKNKDEAVFFSRSTLFKTVNGAKSIEESATGWTGNAWSWTDNSAAFHPLYPDTFAFFCNDIGTRVTTTGGNWFHESTNSESGQWYPDKIEWYGTYAGDFQPIPKSGVMVAAIGAYFKTQLMRTENLGQTWKLVTEGAEMKNTNLLVRFHPTEPNIVYAGNKYSTDAGKTFQLFPFPKNYEDPYFAGMCDAYPDVIYALDKNCSVILRSCDRGQHWEEYSKPGWRFRFFDSLPTFAADPIDPYKVYTLDSKHDLAVFNGQKWTSFNVLPKMINDASYNYIRNVTVDPNNPDIIYAGSFAGGGPMVMRTLDGGKTWKDISENLSRNGGALKVNHHTGELYRGSCFGTWIYPAPYSEVPTPEIPEYKTGLEITPDTIVMALEETKALSAEIFTLCDYQYQIDWSSSDTTVAKVSSAGTVTAVGNGNCIVTAQVSGGIYTAECIVTVDSTDTSAPLIPTFDFQAFTDPNNRLQIIFSNPMQVYEVSLFNLTGTKVLTRSFNEYSFTHQEEINLSELANGIYIVSVSTKNGISAKKIVKH
ncbi:MAG: T9SS type A sorting domain-containing protein [Mariniphaga sp.]|nr:T9SS type A sorting domain-containing protein [Mariniphaga sp.]